METNIYTNYELLVKLNKFDKITHNLKEAHT